MDGMYLPVFILALLIGDRAGSFACGLAGSLAFAAAALCCAFLQVCLIQCFNLVHDFASISLFGPAEYDKAVNNIITLYTD
jgi:hypothetical protein